MATSILASRCLFCQADPRPFVPLTPKNKLKDLTGQAFERLTVHHLVGVSPLRKATWCCLCVCGRTVVVEGASLRSQNTRSCGCLVHETVNAGQFSRQHGKTGSRVFRIWSGMRNRCCNPRAVDFRRYGGRGITVCERWMVFAAFYADMGDPPRGTTLDRRDNNRGYDATNCRWATALEQGNNKRNNRMVTFDGVTLSVSQWARCKGLTYTALLGRLDQGWDLDKALHTPVRPQTRRSTDV